MRYSCLQDGLRVAACDNFQYGNNDVRNSVELKEALCGGQHLEQVMTEPYFCLDGGVPRWRKLLGIGQ